MYSWFYVVYDVLSKAVKYVLGVHSSPARAAQYLLWGRVTSSS